MDKPYPTPSECIDTTPPALWDTLWQTDPKGMLEMPADMVAHDGGKVPMWRNHWFKFQHPDDKFKKLPKKVEQKYWSLFPQGHTEKTAMYEKRQDKKTDWDDQKHGYWNVGGRLQYRSADGKVHLEVHGTDRW